LASLSNTGDKSPIYVRVGELFLVQESAPVEFADIGRMGERIMTMTSSHDVISD
jgi:hypothetical protein